LDAAAAGDRKATADLFPLVYDELRSLAAARMAAEPAEHTLQPTALVHEAFLRLVGPADLPRWETRGHFFAAAAEGMRRILVDAARRKKRIRHGGSHGRVPLPSALPGSDADDPAAVAEMLAVNDVVDRLAEQDPEAAELVKLHVFAGLSIPMAAE